MEKHKHIFIFYYISTLISDGTDSKNPSSWKIAAVSFYIVNIIVADDLATQGAKASAAMVLTYFSRNIPASAPEWLNTKVVDYHCVRKYI